MQKEFAMMIGGTLLFGVLLVTLPKNMNSRAADGMSPYGALVSKGAHYAFKDEQSGGTSFENAREQKPFISPSPLEERPYIATVAAPDVRPIRDWSIDPPKLTASSSIVMLADSEKVLFEHNSAESLPIASITKLLAALTALERGDPQMVIEISKEATEGKRKNWFSAGEHFTLGQLILFMLLPSSNEAAKQVWLSLGGEEFTAAMNVKARTLGMRASYFTNASGLHDPRHHSNARDVALLLKAVLRQDFLIRSMGLQTVTASSEEGRAIVLQNSNKLLGKVPRLIFGKTGFTNESRETLAGATEEGQNRQAVLFVVLGSDDRLADMQRLIEWTREAYKFSW